MTDLICRNTMTRCQTPGMCAPHGGCRVSILVNANVRYGANTAPIALDTIELFPGVKFRKDTTKPHGNQWMFLHEDHWLIAKLEYSDDITLDHVAEVTRERDALLAAIATPESVFINMKAGRIAKVSLRSAIDLHGEVINGDDAQQLEIARLRAEVEELRPNANRYQWLRHADLDRLAADNWGTGDVWTGDQLDTAIDAAMAPTAVAPVEPAPPGPPVPFTDRICHKPDCWYCEGSGWWNGGKCVGDEIPF